MQWPRDYARRVDPGTPVHAWIAESARRVAREGRVRILDVGAGPITEMGYRLEGFDLSIDATDPLAPSYAALLAEHGVSPPVATRFAPMEDLRLFVPEAAYDLVHCRNALDHSLDPVRGIEQMLAAARVGGVVMLLHYGDEAEREAYTGLHQWNMALRDGGTRFVVWNRSGEVDVAAALRCPCRVACVGEGGWVNVFIEKTGPSPPEPAEVSRRRFAAWVDASLGIIGRSAVGAAEREGAGPC